MLATTAFAGAPDEPRQLDFDNLEKEIGKRGGSLKMLMAKPKDVRWMTVYSGARLVAYDETFQLMPDLLKSVDNDSNKSFTLHLRKGHKWSDGQPFTTEDFRYWWEDVAQNEALSKGGPPRELLAAGKLPKVEIIDSHTIRYSWDTVNPLFLTALAGARPMYIYMPSPFSETVSREICRCWKTRGAGRVRKGSKLGVPAQTFWPSVSPGKSGNANIAGLDEYYKVTVRAHRLQTQSQLPSG